MDNQRIAKELLAVARELTSKDDYIDNVWGNTQSVKSIKVELAQAIKTKNPVWNSKTEKTMPNAKFIRETKKILKNASTREKVAAKGSAGRVDKIAQALDRVFEDVKSVLFDESGNLEQSERKSLVELQAQARKGSRFVKQLKRKLK